MFKPVGCSICFWYADEYWQYSTAILLTSLFSLGTALHQTRRNQQNLRNTVVSSEAVTRLCPNGPPQQVCIVHSVLGLYTLHCSDCTHNHTACDE